MNKKKLINNKFWNIKKASYYSCELCSNESKILATRKLLKLWFCNNHSKLFLENKIILNLHRK